MAGKINLNKFSKSNNRPNISKEERDNLLRTKGDEISGKVKSLKENENNSDTNLAKPRIVVNTTMATQTEMERLLKKLPNSNRFIDGIRQQSSINTSDYTTCLIDILVEAKKQEGIKIKKTSYLEKYLVEGIKKELFSLGIEIK